MPLSPDFDDLSESLAGLRRQGVVPRVAEALEGRRVALVADVAQAVGESVAAYRETGNPDVLPELDAHLADIVAMALRLLAGERPRRFDFVVSHARRRAEQRFPLDAVLHAYRLLYRHLSQWIRDAALEMADPSAHVRRVVAAVSDFAAEYTGTLGTLLTAEYVAHTRVLAEAEGDRRMRLLDTLLRGYDESDRVAAQLLRAAGYLEQRQSYCVAVARSVDPREMDNPARAQRMADALADAFVDSPLRILPGVRDNLAVAILSGTRRMSGWTAPQSRVADRAYPLLRKLGPAALIGLSGDVPSTSHVPRAATEARLALDFADVANRVTRYDDIPFQQMLVMHGRRHVQSALPPWTDAFEHADAKASGVLVATLRAYAAADMNVLRTAKALGIHSNTVYARMHRIRDLTGLDPLQYHALTEMLLVTDCTAA